MIGFPFHVVNDDDDDLTHHTVSGGPATALRIRTIIKQARRYMERRNDETDYVVWLLANLVLLAFIVCIV